MTARSKLENPEPKTGGTKVSRRGLVKGALAAAASGVAGLAAGEAKARQAPAADSAAVTVEDIAASDRVAGRSYTETERTLMARSAGRTRTGLKALRALDRADTMEPATHFDPRVSGY